jgi:hypothetical protein
MRGGKLGGMPAADLAAGTTVRSGEKVFIHFVDVE